MHNVRWLRGSIFTTIFVTLASAAPAQTPPTPAANPELVAALAQYEKPELKPIAKGVHLAFAYDFANVMYVEGKDGIVVVDTGWAVERAKASLAAYRAQVSKKPIRAIVYGHGHADHVSGVRAFLEDSPGAAIWASARWERYQRERVSALAPFIGRRVAAQLGLVLPPGVAGTVGNAGGPFYPGAATQSYAPPTRTFSGEHEVTLGGVRMLLVEAPSETDDQIIVWLPEHKVMYGSDITPSGLPIVSTPRQEIGRSAYGWVTAIERMQELPIEHLVSGHGRPVRGRKAVSAHLEKHRDAAQFIHDQVMRALVLGLSADEAVAFVALPPHLANDADLQGYYHPLDVLVRGLYATYAGWLGNDALAFVEVSDSERAKRIAALAGGKDALVAAAREAYDGGEFAWAGELATYALRVDPANETAKRLRVYALRALAYPDASGNVRSYLLTQAGIEDGSVPRQAGAGMSRLNPDVARILSIRDLLVQMGPRLDAKGAGDVERSLEIEVQGAGEHHELAVRRGVIQVRRGAAPKASIRIAANEETLRALLTGQTAWPDAIANGTVAVRAGADALPAFLALFGL